MSTVLIKALPSVTQTSLDSMLRGYHVGAISLASLSYHWIGPAFYIWGFSVLPLNSGCSLPATWALPEVCDSFYLTSDVTGGWGRSVRTVLD